MPGLNPHPREDKDGHSRGIPEPDYQLVEPGKWRWSKDYLYAADLYNYAYWWECHELYESMWHAVPKESVEGLFLQALILSAAANLNLHRGLLDGARRLTEHCIDNLMHVVDTEGCASGRYMGLDVNEFTAMVQRYIYDQQVRPLVLLAV